MAEIFKLISNMAPYLLIGFLLAGIMHVFIPGRLYRKFLRGNSFRTVLNATLLGIPLPLCSCGVIPTAMSLRKEGASKAATVSFLIATPQTGIDSIIATYSLMGLPFALLRPLIALLTSLIGGFITSIFTRKESQDINASYTPSTKENITLYQKLRKVLNYAFVEMMQDIGKWLVIGLIIAGLITIVVPDNLFTIFADKPFLSMLTVLVFAIPMYLCATGSIPIAVALMLKGLSPGTALVLLIAGPAVNAASMLVISKVMGKKTLSIYLLSIIVCSIVFGLGIDYLLPREWFTAPLTSIHDCHGSGISYFNIACSIILFILLCNAFILKYKPSSHCSCRQTHKNETPCTDKWEFIVKGMKCNHCKANVEKSILKCSGVQEVETDLSTGKVVTHGKINRKEIIKAIEDLGFEVTNFQ